MSPAPGTTAPDAPGRSLAEAIDASFGAGPEHPPAGTDLVAGRRLLRRRRRVEAVGVALATVLVGAPALWALASADHPGVVVPPRPDQAELPYGVHRGDLVGAVQGELVVAPGVTVRRTVPNPMGSPLPARSWGLDVERGDVHQWALVEWTPMGGAVISERAAARLPTLRLWLTDLVARQHREQTLALVRFGDGGRLEPRAGVTLLAQQRVGMQGSAEGPTAAAEVRWEGRRWYVLARQVPGEEPTYVPWAAEVTVPRFDTFASTAVQRWMRYEGPL